MKPGFELTLLDSKSNPHSLVHIHFSHSLGVPAQPGSWEGINDLN